MYASLILIVSRIEKRIRFVASTIILSFLFLISITFLGFDRAWLVIPILIATTYALTFLSVLEGIEKIEWTMLFIMPVLFTVSYYVFFFLFPVRWLTRVPFLALFAISIYANLLTTNIFNVGVEKSLRLYKAAYSVNYFYQTVIAFLCFNILFSLHSYFFVNAIVAFCIVFPLSMQLFWTIRLKLEWERDTVLYSLFVAWIAAQIAFAASFAPFKSTVIALVLTASYYAVGGLAAAHIDNRLFKNTIREYTIVLIFVTVVAVLTLLGW